MQTYADNENMAFYIGATAVMLNRSIDTVRRWAKTGRINCSRDGMNNWRVFRLSDINLVRIKMSLEPLSNEQATKLWEIYHDANEQQVSI
jgi:DNA-binding transcriptional MerR regulator